MADNRTDQPADQPADPALITATDRHADIPQLLYGLRLRGIRAEARHAPGKADPWEIVAKTPADARRARPVLGLIWDAVFDASHAITPDNTCPFCAYDLAGAPRPSRHQGRPFICPECGTDLASVEARLAHRRGGDPRRSRV